MLQHAGPFAGNRIRLPICCPCDPPTYRSRALDSGLALRTCAGPSLIAGLERVVNAFESARKPALQWAHMA